MDELITSVIILEYFHKLFDIGAKPVPDDEGSYHYIYVTKNLLNNKIYVGIHSTDTAVDLTYKGSGTRLYKSINLHGWNNFKCIPILYFKSRDLARLKEEELITENYISYIKENNLGYNITKGGGDPPKTTGSDHHVHKKILNGTFISNFGYGDNNVTKKASVSGTLKIGIRYSGNDHWVRKAINNGTFINKFSIAAKKVNLENVNNGTHNLLRTKPWNHNISNTKSKATWWFAPDIIRIKNLKLDSYKKLTDFCSDLLFCDLSKQSIVNIIKYYRKGWEPFNDKDWVKFKNSYVPNFR